jgi:hypothetical protein
MNAYVDVVKPAVIMALELDNFISPRICPSQSQSDLDGFRPGTTEAYAFCASDEGSD